MLNAIASFWHEIVFWLMVAGWSIVAFDHADKVRALGEWLANKLRGIR